MMKADSEPDQVAGSETPTAASAIKDEVDALSGDIEKLFKRAYGEIPKATDLAEMRAIQATMKNLLHRALKADNGAGSVADGAGAGGGDELKKITEERDKLKDALARSKADFLNYQSRASKDLERAEELSLRKYVSELLPILDSLDLMKMDAAGPDANIDRLREAMEMIDTSLRQVMTVRGLERIDAKGKAFDPSIHEAVVKRPAGEGEAANSIAEELRAGYLWKGLILRPTQVLVAEGKK